MERWRKIKGFPRYYVSDCGRIKTGYYLRSYWGRFKLSSPKIINPTPLSMSGHLQFSVSRYPLKRTQYIVIGTRSILERLIIHYLSSYY